MCVGCFALGERFGAYAAMLLRRLPMWDEPKEPRKTGIPAEYVILGLVAAALIVGGLILANNWVREVMNPPLPPKTLKASPKQ